MHRKSIIKKTIQIGSSTLTSRFLGIIRDLLMIRYLGVGLVSDAFTIAYRMPNTLRKVFAEGALSAAFIPLFLATMRKDEKSAMSLMSIAFLIFEGVLLVLCGLAMIFAPSIIGFYAPGFSAEQVAIAVPLLRVLMPLIFFLSSSALLAGALQSIGHFFIPAFGPILLNMVFIGGLLICKWAQLPVIYLCVFILFGGLLQFLQHLYAYFANGLSFGSINHHTFITFAHILGKFFWCALSMSVTEVSIIVDGQFASFLPTGTVTLLSYAHKFMAIPIGVFAVAFSTILLPYFSRISTYAPKRLNFFLFESAKMVFFVMIPCTLGLIFFAKDIFITIFVSNSFTMEQADTAGIILAAFGLGLFFFALNKIILNIYYAMHETFLPGVVSAVALVVNVLFNLLFIWTLGAFGLALATAIAGACQTILLFYFLRKKFGFHGYLPQFFDFVKKYLIQLLAVSTIFLGFYFSFANAIKLLPAPLSYFFLQRIGFWLWVAPLCLMAGLLLYLWRRRFGVRLYFLD
ncbi:MAG: hypothetical protein AMXMBFR12_01140 [Candidatus Babeliales bacterium]